MVICIIYFSTAMNSMYIPPLHAPSQTERLRSSRSAQLAFSLQQVASLNLAFYHYLRLAWQQPFIFIYFLPEPFPLAPPAAPMKWSHSSERGRRIFQTALSAALLIPRALCLKHAEAPLHPSYVCLCPAEISQTPQIRYTSAERAAGPFGPSSPAQGWCNQRRVHPTPGMIACMRAANRKGEKKHDKKGAFAGSNARFPTEEQLHKEKTTKKHVSENVQQAGTHKPFLSVPLGTGEVLMPLAISWLAVSLVTTEALSLVFGASRAFSFLACLVPL